MMAIVDADCTLCLVARVLIRLAPARAGRGRQNTSSWRLGRRSRKACFTGRRATACRGAWPMQGCSASERSSRPLVPLSPNPLCRLAAGPRPPSSSYPCDCQAHWRHGGTDLSGVGDRDETLVQTATYMDGRRCRMGKWSEGRGLTTNSCKPLILGGPPSLFLSRPVTCLDWTKALTLPAWPLGLAGLAFPLGLPPGDLTRLCVRVCFIHTGDMHIAG